jgi:DNA-binding response OmpR family regulator
MSSDAKPLIVIVEDEDSLAQVVATHLEEAGMQAQICNRAAHASRFLRRNYANLVLLDLNLPDQSGFGLFEELQQAGIDVPIIFMTGNTQELSKIKGLEMGGDDYVTKPFSYAELIARIRAVLRRTDTRRDANVTRNARLSDSPFDFGGASIVPGRLEIEFPDGQIETIGRKELGILAFLCQAPGTVITRKSLIHAVWGEHADVKSRSLDQYIVKVRDLYRKHGIELDGFRTVHGVGYIYEPQA